MNKAALLAAAVAALIGIALLWLYMERFEEEASGGTPVAVVMATQDIPLGTTFQFRALGDEPLCAIGATMPPWPGPGEAVLAEGPWTPTVPPGPT